MRESGFYWITRINPLTRRRDLEPAEYREGSWWLLCNERSLTSGVMRQLGWTVLDRIEPPRPPSPWRLP